MSTFAVLSYVSGILGPIALAAACVFELLARRHAAKAGQDAEQVEKLRRCADVGLVAAWLLLAAAYMLFKNLAPDADALAVSFQSWMTWMLGTLLVLDILYLYLRRARPKKPGEKKRFWEI